MVKERILWIDFIKLLAIYFVVLGHVILFMGLDRDEVMHQNALYSLLYSFHMPLFMTNKWIFLSQNNHLRREYQAKILTTNSSLHKLSCYLFNF